MTQTMAPLGQEIPGGVYLCQVTEQVSCGACCGLYNVADPSRETLSARLARRAARFAVLPREIEAILAFGQEESRSVEAGRPLPEFHHCPFLGLIGAGGQRVGCLLHPLAAGNGGVDFRGLSHYGGLACRVYFCASYRRLPSAIKRLLSAAADNWYDYGLTISEIHLIQAFFEAVAQPLGRPLDELDLAHGGAALLAAAKRLLAIKARWPFRAAGMSLGHDVFAAASPRPLTRLPPACSPSRYMALLRELGTQLASPRELAQAETLIDELIGEMRRALERKAVAGAAAHLV